MKPFAFFLLASSIPACVAGQTADAVPLKGLPPSKDPAAWVYNAEDARWVLLAMEGGGKLRTWIVREQTVGPEVALELPPIEPGYVRWGPCLFEDGGTLWMCSGVGKAFDWPTYRLRVAECSLAEDIERGPAGDPARIRFRDERQIDFVPDGEFRGARDYAVIDPEFARDGSGLWLFATVVLHGAPNVRPHQEFIRARRATSPRALMPGNDLVFVHDGFNDALDGDPHRNLDDGVAEAPTWIGDGKILYSSWPSDNDQRIALLESSDGIGGTWTLGPTLLAANPDASPRTLAANSYEQKGVGGQTVVELHGKKWLVYQGLGTVGTEKKNRFRLVMRDLDALSASAR